VSNAPVGGHPITVGLVEGTGLTNYTIGTSNGVLTVSAASLLVSALDTNKVYGATLSPLAYSVSGLLNGDTVTNVALSSTGSVSNAPVGGHPITVGLVEGTGLTNYTIGTSNGLLTVNAAALTITALDASKTQGSTLTFAGTEFSVAGLTNGDAVSSVTLASTGAAAGAAAGTYPITVTNAVGTGLSNYSIAYVSGTLTVTNPGGQFVITSIVPDGGSAIITWNSVSNATYVLQYKDDFTATNWSEVPVTIPSGGVSTTFTNDLAGAQQRYFRVRLGTAAPLVPAPQITAIVKTGDDVVVSWTSVAGHFYRLQFNNDLTTTNWTDVLPEITAAGAVSSATNSVTGVEQRFYRVWLRE
jgi:hypothetical protein